jgi:hypothetical protein
MRDRGAVEGDGNQEEREEEERSADRHGWFSRVVAQISVE